MARPTNPLTGILVVDKPGLPEEGPDGPPAGRLATSHDIVQQVRRWSGQRRIGHTGTLDPMASGVLVLCLGQATRLVEYYQGHDKVYRAQIRLGRTTDSYDRVGKPLAEQPVPPLSPGDLEEVLSRFRGPIQQRPPAFSAVKQGGESAHRKARRGEEVSLPMREVVIHRLTLLEWHPPDRLSVAVHCSAGTYIRSLAHDLGQALGCGAHLACLRRERSGPFGLERALTLDEAEAAFRRDPQGGFLLPLDAGLDWPRLRVASPQLLRLGQGQKVALPKVGGHFPPDRLVIALDEMGHFCGLMRQDPAGHGAAGEPVWKAEKWFS